MREKNITVNIIDTGVGIEKKDIEKIFNIDQKTSFPGTDSEEGTGLGLILCTDMLALMGASLKVESEKGKGSRFFFELPLAE
jgi:signal transduction histidine kinase